MTRDEKAAAWLERFPEGMRSVVVAKMHELAAKLEAETGALPTADELVDELEQWAIERTWRCSLPPAD